MQRDIIGFLVTCPRDGKTYIASGDIRKAEVFSGSANIQGLVRSCAGCQSGCINDCQVIHETYSRAIKERQDAHV